MTHVHGVDDDHGYGVFGESDNALGVGVKGTSKTGAGVRGKSTSAEGVYGESNSHIGVWGQSNSTMGVFGRCESNIGVGGTSVAGFGVYGGSIDYVGTYGRSESAVGVAGESPTGTGIYGHSNRGLAAYLDGRVSIIGYLYKGGGGFKIDHPLDPANKYLYHSFVESPDMKNVYDGVVALDNKDEAEIDLPDWFSALNKDFRYQLTAIGAPGPNLYIAEEISEATTTNYSSSSSNNNNNNSSRFRIAGGASGMKVSWQVTGIRKDPWANANRIEVEEDKPDKERGYYLHPELYGQPEERGISNLIFPKDKRREEVVARAAHK